MPKGKNDNKSTGGGSRVANLIADAGKSLSGKEVQQIAKQTRYTPASIIARAEKADVNVKPSAQSFVQQAINTQTSTAVQRATESAPVGTTPSFTYTPQGRVASVNYTPIEPQKNEVFGEKTNADPLAGTVSFSELEASNKLALAGIQKQIAQLQEAGATERTKYEIDNRIPFLQAESKGKIDLQAIVNAGYKNIANIGRGTEMVRNITSMFNF
jgi:predicted phage tail protein